jgi:hypothetical protein
VRNDTIRLTRARRVDYRLAISPEPPRELSPMSQKTWAAAAVTFILGALSSACTSGGIGDPCTPEDEYQQGFSGYAVSEVNMESRSFQCETRLCLVNHFQGRVSCPYGQDTTNGTTFTVPFAASATTIDDPAKRCNIPGTQEAIVVSVLPQVKGRRPIDSVYCSCRCDGADPNARYCKCPSGFECVSLLTDISRLGSRELAGSYCIKQGTTYNPNTRGGTCTWGSGECGPYNGVE